MKRARYICCGTASGKLLLRDPRTFKVEHTIDGHTGSISDMDVSGNTIATCGFSNRYILFSSIREPFNTTT